MKILFNPICRSGRSIPNTGSGNKPCEAWGIRFCKLHQLSLVTQMVPVNLSDMLKPAIPDEATATCNLAGTRGKMMLRAG